MAEHRPRRFVLATIGTTSLGLAGCLDSNGSGSGARTGDASDSSTGTDPSDADADELPDWMTTELEDVTTDETFTLAAIDVPVLLETFAVWCPDCLDQQNESATFHEQTELDVVSIGLNVDPNEDADVVRDHAETHGFDWRFAVSPPEMTRSLVDEFGQSIAHPPASPVVLRCPDGTARRLEDGLVTADALESAVEAEC